MQALLGWDADSETQVGPDPRGLGASSPIACDRDIWNERVSLFPQDKEGYDALVSKGRRFSESCLNMTGNDLFLHMDTVSVARDFDAIRVALGEQKLNFLGYSYGSELGVQYAELFPDRVGRMVLDGLVDHFQPEVSALMSMSITYDASLRRFFEWCENDQECALHGRNVSQIWTEILDQADKGNLTVPGCDNVKCFITVTAEDVISRVQDFMAFKYLASGLSGGPTTWKDLGAFLKNASEGDPSAFAVYLLGPEYSAAVASSSYGFRAVGCLDFLHSSRNVQDLKNRQRMLETFAPLTRGLGEMWDWSSSCLGWPTPLKNPPHFASVRGAPPILLVQSLYYPECSYEWAVGLKGQVQNSALITGLGDGHTSYMLGGQTSKAMDVFLIDGILPIDGSTYED